jgi:thiol-disulfide isomerase/thioredoxin
MIIRPKALSFMLPALVAVALAQTPTAPDPRSIGPAAPNPATLQRLAGAPQFTPEEVQQLKALLARLNPPPLEGQMLPEKLRTAKVNVFMSSTCPHCAKEVPHLAELEKAGVSVNPVFYDKEDGAAQFLTAGGWQHKPVLLSAEDLKGLPIAGTPTTVLADASGKITKSWRGELTDAQHKELLALARAK